MNYLKSWLPSRGNVLFTLVIAASLIFYVHSVGAFPSVNQPKAPEVVTSTGTIAYQGRLFSASGVPLNSTYPMTFTFYNVSTGGSALWTEARPGVTVSDGLFNVLLGSVTPITQSIITSNNSLWLGVQVGADPEMIPRVQLGSAPFAMQGWTVPDGSITTNQVADGSLQPVDFTPFASEAFDSAGYGTTSSSFSNLGNTNLTFTITYPSKVYLYLRAGMENPTAGGQCAVTLSVDGQNYYSNGRLYLQSDVSAWKSMGTSGVFTMTSGVHAIQARFSNPSGIGTCLVANTGYGYVVLGRSP